MHRATLANGTEVAVKVQRAGLKALFDLDLKNLKVLATLLDRLDPKTDGADREWAAIYDESARLLYLEIDYENEARNAMRFAANFAGQADAVRVPRVELALSTPRVLTMEYVPSVKLTDMAALDALGLDKGALATSVATTFLQQLLRDGYFHCDPHPGNLCVDETVRCTLVAQADARAARQLTQPSRHACMPRPLLPKMHAGQAGLLRLWDDGRAQPAGARRV